MGLWKSIKKGVSSVTDAIGITGGGDAGDAARDATNSQVKYQREALDYLKEVEKLPQQFREEALKKLGGIAGLEGGEGSQQELIDQAQQSPLYNAIMGTQEAGRDEVMRNAGMTGGLRSGNVQDDLFSYGANLKNRATNEAFNQQLQGIQGLAGLPSNANNIATATSGIGSTLAQGTIAEANADAASSGGMFGNLMNLGTTALKGFNIGGFSDRRLKKNLVLVGQVGSFNWYSWDWNALANSIGLEGSSQGVLADEVVDQQRKAVSFKSGYMFIDYSKLEDRHAARI